MTRAIITFCTSLALLSACGDGGSSETAQQAATDSVATTAPAVTFTPGDPAVTTTKPQSPIQIKYRIIGTPIVGQPVAVELEFESALTAKSFDVSYRVNDSTALQFPESQARKVAVVPSLSDGNLGRAAQQISVIPMREGRLYLNVAAEMETGDGSFSSVTAVPIQVGPAPREITENGVVTTDENGELIRTLPARED